MGNGRGGSSPDRSPNDDRSDVMNPNNDAYDYDQLNRFGDDDDWGQGASNGSSEYARWADGIMDRIQRNEVRRDQARRDLKEAERRYGDESLPYEIAQEKYLEAERSWEGARSGERAYQQAASWWEMARIERSRLAPGEEGFCEFLWELQGASPEEGSSSNNSSGSDINPLPKANICCSPPLKVPASRLLLISNTGKVSQTNLNNSPIFLLAV